MALAATVELDVRTTGSDNNGGGFDPVSGTPGTDYSQQAAAQIAYTDLVIQTTTTQLQSAGNPFTSAHVGNIINITGGSGFTTGRYQVMSVSGSTATMDRSVGTASSTGGTGNLGGALLTIGAAITIANVGSTFMSVHLKNGTYTITSTLTISSNNSFRVVGFNATHNDGGSRPTITTSTNSVHIFTCNGCNELLLDNLILSSSAGTPGNGIEFGSAQSNLLWMRGCKLSGFAKGIHGDFNTVWTAANIVLDDVEITACTTRAIENSFGTTMRNCWIHDNTGANNDGLRITTGGTVSDYSIFIRNCIFSGNGGCGISDQIGKHRNIYIGNCVFYNNSSDGYQANFSAAINAPSNMGNYGCSMGFENNIFVSNGGYGRNNAGATGSVIYMDRYNAYYNNTSGNQHNMPTGTNVITLTGVPFNNAAGGDFSLNTVANQGALLIALGYPQNFNAGLSTNTFPDVGAAQSKATNTSQIMISL